MRLSSHGRYAWAVVAGWVLAILATLAAAQSSRMELSIVAGTVEAGTVAKVPIRISSPVGIGAAQFEIVYDSAVLRFNGVENGSLLPAGLFESNVVQPGRARVALVSNEQVKGAGVLLLAEFEVFVGPATTTLIGLEAVRGWDQANNLPVSVASQSGEWMRTAPVRPIPGKEDEDGIPTWLYWVVGASVVGVAVLGAVVFVLRRPKKTEHPFYRKG